MDAKENDHLLIGRIEYPNLPFLYLQIDLPQAANVRAERLDVVSRGEGPCSPIFLMSTTMIAPASGHSLSTSPG
jgi:hypothetical protein